MKTHYANTSRGGVPYTATLIVGAAECLETVTRHGPMGAVIVHQAAFETSCLGTASRDGYTRAMLATIADRDTRVPAA